MKRRQRINRPTGAPVFPRVDAGPVTFTIDNAVDYHEASPETFYLPPVADRESLAPGDLAKLIFRITGGKRTAVERMWVIVQELSGGGYVGVLDNDPYCTDSIRHGLRVEFKPEHVIQIQRQHAAWPQEWVAQ